MTLEFNIGNLPPIEPNDNPPALLKESDDEKKSISLLETRDFENGAVVMFFDVGRGREQPIMTTLYPTKGKYIVGLSAQIGCAVGCNHCDILPLNGDLTQDQINQQLKTADSVAGDRGISLEKIFKIGFTDSGEILWNRNFPQIMDMLTKEYPKREIKISTTFPDNKMVEVNTDYLMQFVSRYPDTFLQISLSSTNEKQVKVWHKHPPLPFDRIAEIGKKFTRNHLKGRLPTLIFTLVEGRHLNPFEMVQKLSPHYFKIVLGRFQQNYTDCEPMAEEEVEKTFQSFSDCGYDIIGDFDDAFLADQLIRSSSRSL